RGRAHRLVEAPGSHRRERKGNAIVRFVILGLTCLALAGCQRKSDDDAGDVRGQPIASGTTNTAARTSPSPKADKVGDYQVVGFDKLAAYNFEVSDELLAPATNNAAM